MSAASMEDAKWLEGELAAKFEIKTKIVGHGAGCDSEGEILNRVIRATKDGFEMEADPKHGELIVETLGLKESKGAVTAGIDAPDDDPDELLAGDDVCIYRSLAARANYLAIDRPDLHSACKKTCAAIWATATDNHLGNSSDQGAGRV